MENEYREEGSSIVGPKKQKKQSKSSLTSSELNILKEQGIEYLEYLHQRINNRKDVRLLSRMQQELNKSGEMSPEMYLWWVNRY